MGAKVERARAAWRAAVVEAGGCFECCGWHKKICPRCHGSGGGSVKSGLACEMTVACGSGEHLAPEEVAGMPSVFLAKLALEKAEAEEAALAA